MRKVADAKSQQQQAGLGYEYSKLASWRNLLVATLVVVMVLGVLYIVARNRPAAQVSTPSANPPSNNTSIPGGGSSSGTNGGHNSSGVTAATKRDVIPVPREMDEQIVEMARLQGIGQQLWNSDRTQSVNIGNVLCFESTPEYTHSVVIESETKRYHLYDFKYACGHGAMVTPDPFRNVIFADPAALAREYGAQLCSDCQRMQEYLDQQKAGSSASGTPAKSGGQADGAH